MMNEPQLKLLEAFIQRYAVPIFVVVVVLSSVLVPLTVFMVQKYEDLLRRTEELGNEKIKLEQKKIDLEKRGFIIQERENLVQQRETNLASQMALLEQGKKETATAVTKLQQEEVGLSLKSRRAKAEDQIQKLMAEFSELGIDLDDPPCPEDVEGQRRYNSAKAKLQAISAIAAANDLSDKYEYFIRISSGVRIHYRLSCSPSK